MGGIPDGVPPLFRCLEPLFRSRTPPAGSGLRPGPAPAAGGPGPWTLKASAWVRWVLPRLP